MRRRRNILFLCTGNTSRSQMAEAIVNSRLGEEWQAFSAGTKPGDRLHPRALAALAEIGIQHHGRPKPADEFRNVDFDLVVTVCDSAAEECPAWLPVPRPGGVGGKDRRLHRGFPDPAKTDNMDDFRNVRDAIEREIIPLLQNYT